MSKPVAIDCDLECGQCGYNLRGLNANGCCPECGFFIGETIEIEVNRWHTGPKPITNRATLSELLNGGVLALVAYGAGWALACSPDGTFVQDSRARSVILWLMFIIAAMSWWAGWKLTVRDPSVRDESRWSVRRIARVCIGVAFVAFALPYVLSRILKIPGSAATPCFFVPLLIAAAFSYFLHLSKLFDRMKAWKTSVLCWGLGVVNALLMLTIFAPTRLPEIATLQFGWLSQMRDFRRGFIEHGFTFWITVGAWWFASVLLLHVWLVVKLRRTLRSI